MTAGTQADAIDDVVPESVEAPATAEALAGLLAGASRDGRPTVIMGGGSKLGWGRRPARVGLIIQTARLNRVLSHRHGDLIATVEGGARLADVNDALAQHQQWLPIDAPEGATIGGVLSTNDSGPLRHRYGTPRDVLIGIQLAMTDGHLVKAGGQVVKNVAGYDLGKLVCGAHGSLAAIVSATFKLAPIVRLSKTLVARFADPAGAAEAVAEIGASQLDPMSCDLNSGADADGAFEVLVRVASTRSAVDAQVARLTRICAKASQQRLVEGGAETAAWRGQSRRVWTGEGAVLRVSWQPSNGGPLMALLMGLESAEGARISLAGRAGIGAGFVRVDGNASAQRRVIERLRAASPIARHVVVLRASREIKDALDVWGELGDAAEATRALKRAFDPAGILNAGRGPI